MVVVHSDWVHVWLQDTERDGFTLWTLADASVAVSQLTTSVVATSPVKILVIPFSCRSSPVVSCWKFTSITSWFDDPSLYPCL